MDISHLMIAEFPANLPLPPAALNGAASSSLFEICTCQRSLLIGTRESFPTLSSRRLFKGEEAYRFLLNFSCGLESEIKGETDVFGQVKTAVKRLAKENPKLSDSLQSIFLRLFEDTKEIRTQYLQGIGGNTYGTLSRRILNPTPEDQIVILGAGQISKSVAPYFAEFGLKIWNRSFDRLSQLAQELSLKGHSNFTLLQSDAELETALQEATVIILATPAGAEMDSKILEHALSTRTPTGSMKKILHLGGQAQDTTHFQSYSQFWSLTDLFAIEKEQNIFREKQVQQALDACNDRAILRNLSRSLYIPHGWEDLALFY